MPARENHVKNQLGWRGFKPWLPVQQAKVLSITPELLRHLKIIIVWNNSFRSKTLKQSCFFSASLFTSTVLWDAASPQICFSPRRSLRSHCNWLDVLSNFLPNTRANSIWLWSKSGLTMHRLRPELWFSLNPPFSFSFLSHPPPLSLKG